MSAKHDATRALVLRIICLCILVAIAVAGLSPFNPFPRNDAAWIADQNGIHFGGAGIALTRTNLTWPSASSAATLELFLRPDAANHTVNDILTFYTPEAPQRFRLFNWGYSTLLLYHDVGGEHREMDILHAFRPGTPLLITITAGPQGTAVYLDGVLNQKSSRLKLSPADFSGQLILGAAPLSYQTWSGEVRGLAFYGAELSAAQVQQHFEFWSRNAVPPPQSDEAPITIYPFSERSGPVARDQLAAAPNLEIPAAFVVPHKHLLLPPSKDFWGSRGFFRDAAINVAGFMFLGFFFYLYLSKAKSQATSQMKSESHSISPALQVILLGAAISLTIEILQLFLPTRASSLVDVATNTLGTAFGVLLCQTIAIPIPRAVPEAVSSKERKGMKN